MDFFERQDRARRNTKLPVVYFILGVALLIVAVYAAALVIFTGVVSRHHYVYGEQAQLVLWNPQLFLGTAVGTLAVIALGSGFKTLELAQGGSAVATMLGGRLVDPATTDPDERKLRNVVEEMAIAAGVPAPQVYLLPEEKGINAFAAGHSTSDAVIAVTVGAVKLLTRDELQGVIGHEFSHILNGDMRLNLRLMGIIFGILCLAVIGRVLLYTRSRGSKDKNPLPLLGLALLVIGWIGVLFSRLIQAAVSRQREFLADASSVQFTRNPAGLAGALKKIGGLRFGSKLEAAHAEEASHMFFGNGMGESFFHLMDTHPPLAERISAIDPSFDGAFPPVAFAEAERATPRVSPPPQRSPLPFPFPGLPRHQAGLAGLAPPVIAVQTMITSTGTPTSAHLRYAEGLRVTIPASLQAAAREGLGASTLVYALLMSDDEATRGKQLDELAAATSAAVCQETLTAFDADLLLPSQIVVPPDVPGGFYDYIANLSRGSQPALQALLKNKFGLAGKHEMRDMDVLLLKVDHPGARGLQPGTSPPPGQSRGLSLTTDGIIHYRDQPISHLAKKLEVDLQIPVLDQTGLTGTFDMDVPDVIDGETTAERIEAARRILLDEFGLRLVSNREPHEVFIIEKVK
jgi:Zn-dependent protease with chaperone function